MLMRGTTAMPTARSGVPNLQRFATRATRKGRLQCSIRSRCGPMRPLLPRPNSPVHPPERWNPLGHSSGGSSNIRLSSRASAR